jgi:hypothetical protein
MKRKILTAGIAVAMLAAASLTPAEAGKNRDVGIAVAAGIAAIGLAAASAAAAHRDNEYYDYHHGHGSSTNAIAACVHRADKVVRRQGGLYVRLDRVRRTEPVANGIRVVADMTGVYPRYRKTSRVRCVVDHDRVVRFRYN